MILNFFMYIKYDFVVLLRACHWFIYLLNIYLGARNWGATEFHEVEGNSTFETELRLKTVDQIIGTKKISLMKVDCEGCEWAAIKG